MKKSIVTTVLASLIILIGYSNIDAAPLRAGAVRVNITRDQPTAPVNDSLYAKVLVLDDGTTKAVIIAIDIVVVKDSFMPELRKRLQNELEIDGNNVLVNASHNHHVNDQLAEDYLNRIIKGVGTASQHMVQVKIGAGTGEENRITMNRRLKLKNGKEWTIRRAIPTPPNDSIVGIAGPFDPEIGILRIDKTDGKPLAVLYNFAGHPYGGVPNKGATACFPGFASRTIEENLGNGAVALFLQGAQGDVTPILYKDVNAPRPAEALGNMLGMSILRAYENIPVRRNEGIDVIRQDIELPVRTDIPERIEALESRKNVILDYFKGKGCGAHGGGTSLNFETFLPLYIKYMLTPQYPSYYAHRYMQEETIGKNDLERMDADNMRDIEKYLNNIRRMEELIMIESNLLYLRDPIPQNPIKAEIVGMKIGEFVIISFPGELFSRVGLNIKERSPHEYTFISGLTNGWIPGSYAPTADAYDGEAYEASLSKLAPEWQQIYEEKVLNMLNRLK